MKTELLMKTNYFSTNNSLILFIERSNLIYLKFWPTYWKLILIKEEVPKIYCILFLINHSNSPINSTMFRMWCTLSLPISNRLIITFNRLLIKMSLLSMLTIVTTNINNLINNKPINNHKKNIKEWCTPELT